MKYLIFTVLLIAELNGKTIKEYETEKKVDQLLLLVQKRLSLMHEVAKIKWNKDLAIEDKAREETILNTLSQKINPVDKSWIIAFFKAQIEAAKQMQKADFSCWKREGIETIDTTLSLNVALREYIDRLNDEMLDLLSKVSQEDLKKTYLNKPISIRDADSIPQDVWNTAIDPIR